MINPDPTGVGAAANSLSLGNVLVAVPFGYRVLGRATPNGSQEFFTTENVGRLRSTDLL